MSDELIYLTACEQVARYRDGSLSPVAVTEAVLARIDAVEPQLNAFRLVDAEAARADARASEDRWRRGEPKGLVDGVATSIKDLHLTKGWSTLRGSRTTVDEGPWEVDAPCVARLREHGAVLLGKTTTPEFGWKGLGDSPLTGTTGNPWNPAKTPGGSSAGAAAAVVSGMGALGIGSDGGGSIRIPSAFSGCFGIKANFGRVPAWPASAMGTLSHTGPMTRSVEDAALMLNVIAEPDPRDWTALPFQGIDFTAGLRAGVAGLRVAYSPALGYATVDRDVAGLVAAAAECFEEMGAVVEEVDPGFADPAPMFRTLWWTGAAGAFGQLPAESIALMDPELQEIIAEGGELAATEVHAAQSARAELGKAMRLFHTTYDLLLTPSLAVTAFDVGRLHPPHRPPVGHWLEWTPFSYPFNLTQQPACSIPCGFTPEGLPVGLQIVADNFREDLVLRAAAAYQAARPISRRPDLG